MSNESDIALIKRQETELAFTEFNELVAHSLGERIRERALREKLVIVVDIRTWDRQLYFMALPGTTADNAEWVRRKRNVVLTLATSTLAVGLKLKASGETLEERYGLPPRDHAAHGGGFPLILDGLGCIGAITVSGLPQVEDHALVVEVLERVLAGKER